MNFDEDYKKIGKRIKFLRENAGFTQEQLSEKAKISIDFLGKIEVNINKPGFKTILKLTKALDLTLEEFFKTI